MVLVHKVFRREFGLLPVLLAGVDAGNTARIALIAAHANELSTALRHHHAAEQDLLWHRLRDRDALDESLHGRLRDRQRKHFALLSELDGLLPLWTGSGAPDLQAVLVDIAGELSGLVAAHLDAVEHSVLPAVELDPAAPDGLDARRDVGGRHRRRTQDPAGQGAGSGAVAVPNGGPGPIQQGDIRIARGQLLSHCRPHR